MTEAFGQLALPSGSAPPRDITFELDMPRLRDAWRAASSVKNEGTFTIAILTDKIRLQADAEIAVEATVPVAGLVGLEPTAEIHLNVANESLAALGLGDLEERGLVILERFRTEEGFSGVLKLRTSFIVTWPYTLTAVRTKCLEPDAPSGIPVDPRTIRTALAEIRDFAGENDRSGNNLSTLQVCNSEALGMSGPACHSIRSASLSDIQLRAPASSVKALGALLGQMRASDTKLMIGDKVQVLFDGRIKLTVPLAPALPNWPDLGSLIAELQIDVSDLIDAITAISLQAQPQDPIATLNVEEGAATLTLNTVVPGGLAIASCPISSANRIQVAPIELRFNAKNLARFTSHNNDAVTIRIFQHLIELSKSLQTSTIGHWSRWSEHAATRNHDMPCSTFSATACALKASSNAAPAAGASFGATSDQLRHHRLELHPTTLS